MVLKKTKKPTRRSPRLSLIELKDEEIRKLETELRVANKMIKQLKSDINFLGCMLAILLTGCLIVLLWREV